MTNKTHEPFHRIRGYQYLQGLTDEEMSERLGCTPRTYRNKIKGRYDFKVSEAAILCKLFGQTYEHLFFEQDVSQTTQA